MMSQMTRDRRAMHGVECSRMPLHLPLSICVLPLFFLLPFLYAEIHPCTRLVVPGSSPGASKPAPLWSYPKSPGDFGAVIATTGTTLSVTARQSEGPPVKCCDWRSRHG